MRTVFDNVLPWFIKLENAIIVRFKSAIHMLKNLKLRFLITGIILSTVIASFIYLNPQNASGAMYQSGIININKSYENKLLKTADLSGGISPKYEEENIFESEEITPNFDFNGIIAEWRQYKPEGTSLDVYLKFKRENIWSDWEFAEVDEDSIMPGINGKVDSLLSINNAESFKYKIVSKTEDSKISPKITELNFEYIKSSEPAMGGGTVLSENLLAGLVMPDRDKTIISRAAWGANEALTYKIHDESNGKDLGGIENSSEITAETKDKNGISKVEVAREISNDIATNEPLKWPLEYPDKVSKIIIHHTATGKDLKRPQVAIRNIYYYHAVRKGWGDIGYNYIIDEYGNIYEGRKGGEGVTGGHAYGFNRGTVGIALLGNYENDEPSFKMLSSLINLLNNISDKNGIDPMGVSSFNNKIIPNISGHYEVAATKCPGAKVKEILPAIRKVTAGIVDTKESLSAAPDFSLEDKPLYGFCEVDDFEPIRLTADSLQTFTVRLKNCGSKEWNNETFLVANQNGENKGHIEFPEKYIISKQKESKVKPGEIGTYSIKLQSGLKSGFLAFDLTLIYDGTEKTSKYLNLPVYIEKPDIRYNLEKAWINKEKYEFGEAITGYVEVKNTGGISWTKDGAKGVKLIFAEPLWRQSGLMPKGQLVAATLEQEMVKPGETGRFNLSFKAPNYSAHLVEKMALYNDSLGAIEGTMPEISLNIGSSLPGAEFVTISSETNFKPGETKDIEFQLKNTGHGVWKQNGDDEFKVAVVKNPGIEMPTTINFTETQVNTGETAHFKFKLKAPQKSGTYIIRFVPWYHYTRMLKTPLELRISVGDEAVISEQTEKPMRIKLSFNEPDVKLTAGSNYSLYSGDKNLTNLLRGQQVEIAYSDGKYIITGNQLKILSDSPIRVIPEAEGIIEIQNMEKRPSWNPVINDNRFRGIIEVRNYDNELIVINELPLEDYIKGIGEVPDSEPAEKIKTIMVLARTYAKFYRDKDEKFPGAPYHLNDNPDECQKYLGYNFELRGPNIIKAVNETRGEVVTYNDELIKTPYFNSSDGRTRSAYEVWGWTHTPYLKSVPDPLCTQGVLRGHGVGLSGCGATEAAKLGKTYREIIEYYYQDIEVSSRTE